MLPNDLIERLKARAADPKRRTDAASVYLAGATEDGPGTARTTMAALVGGSGGGNPLGAIMQSMVGALLSGRGVNPQAMAEQIAGDVRAGRTSLDEVLGGARPGSGTEIWDDRALAAVTAGPPAPATEQDLAQAEEDLGFALPDDLRQFYASVANGGVGPNGGLGSLAEITARYRDLLSAAVGEGGQMWPRRLLPIVLSEPGADCYDLDDGTIVLWDEERLADGPDDETWNASFEVEGASLAEWLETWLDAPVAADPMAKARTETARVAVDAARAMTPGQRTAMGLPEEGWAEAICRNHGADPKDVL